MLLAKTDFEFHARLQKCHFGNFSILALFKLCMKFKKNLAKRLLLRHYESAIYLNYL